MTVKLSLKDGQVLTLDEVTAHTIDNGILTVAYNRGRRVIVPMVNVLLITFIPE